MSYTTLWSKDQTHNTARPDATLKTLIDIGVIVSPRSDDSAGAPLDLSELHVLSCDPLKTR